MNLAKIKKENIMNNKVTYKKLTNGDFGLRITGFTPVEGQVVEVQTKSGKIQKETVGKIIWQGQDKFEPGVYAFLCSIAPKKNKEAKPSEQVVAPPPQASKPDDNLITQMEFVPWANGTTDPFPKDNLYETEEAEALHAEKLSQENELPF